MNGLKTPMFDSTGTYYWCEKVDFDTATVVSQVLMLYAIIGVFWRESIFAIT